jgi:RNA polymerase sigma-70 factor (sigma-E family)
LRRGGSELTVSEVVVAAKPQADGGFEEFVAARGGALWRTAWLLTGDRQRAEDLVQTALGKAWPHWRRVSDTGSFEAYVRRVLYTTYVAWWRRRWNAEAPTADVPEAPGRDEAEAVAARRDVVAALARLPRGQRAVVVLRYFEDLTEAQTAAVLGCSVGTVKSQCSRALAALRSSPALTQTQSETEKEHP